MTSAPSYIAEFKWMLMLVVIVKLRLSYWPRSHTWLVTEFSWLSDQCPLIRKSGRCIKPWIVNAFQFSPELSWKLCNGLCFGATFLLIFTVRTTVNMQQVTANNFFLCSLDVYLSPSTAAWCWAPQIPELRGHTQAWEPWFQQKSRPCGHTFWTLKRPFWYLMKSACEQGQLMFSESSRFKEIELLENHNWTQLTWWNKSVGLSCPLLRDWFTTLTAFSASSRSSPINFVLHPLRKSCCLLSSCPVRPQLSICVVRGLCHLPAVHQSACHPYASWKHFWALQKLNVFLSHLKGYTLLKWALLQNPGLSTLFYCDFALC